MPAIERVCEVGTVGKVADGNYGADEGILQRCRFLTLSRLDAEGKETRKGHCCDASKSKKGSVGIQLVRYGVQGNVFEKVQVDRLPKYLQCGR